MRRERLPPGWRVLIDRKTRERTLNAGINASTCPFFVSMDADSLIDPDALLQAFRVMLADDGVVVIGGQVAIANGCVIQRASWRAWGFRDLPRPLQIVEYVFVLPGADGPWGSGLILIISGVFGIFRKDIVQRVGGYLTRSVTGKLVREYVGEGRDTVCEDMEIIVRISDTSGKAASPEGGLHAVPALLTQVPEDARSPKRNRPAAWRNALLPPGAAVLRRHGRVGMFAYGYFLLFEFLGALLKWRDTWFSRYLSAGLGFVLDVLPCLRRIRDGGIRRRGGLRACRSGGETEEPNASLLRYRGADVAILLLHGLGTRVSSDDPLVEDSRDMGFPFHGQGVGEVRAQGVRRTLDDDGGGAEMMRFPEVRRVVALFAVGVALSFIGIHPATGGDLESGTSGSAPGLSRGRSRRSVRLL
jgi:hypothetical protein